MIILRLLMLLAALSAAGVAHAGLLPVTVTTLPESGKHRWSYNIVLPTDSQLRSGDFFTIYDFAGYVANSNSQPMDWEFSSNTRGMIPAGLAPNDDPNVPNLTWTYRGPTIVTGSKGLGNFWAVSLYSDETTSDFTARTHRTSDGAFDANLTNTSVPVPSGPNNVPEPATLLMAGLGLPIVGLVRRYRGQK